MDGMKRLVLVLVLVPFLFPAAARAAGCRPLDCAPTSSPLGHGLVAVRPQGVMGPVVVHSLRTGATKWWMPPGMLAGSRLVTQDTAKLTWWDALTDRKVATATVHGKWGFIAGTSQDGGRAVLTEIWRGSTLFQIVMPQSQRTITLKGTNWGFDALAGSNLYLLRYLKNGYEVRRYDLAQHRLIAAPLKDPHESSLIWGTSWSRVNSPDGRYVFTLYIGQDGGAMVHELDVRHSTARCVELPGSGNFNLGTTYTMQLSRDGKTLWAVTPGFGWVVGIDVASAKVRVAFRFSKANVAEAPAASVSDLLGSRMAVGVGGDVWVIDLAKHTVRRLHHHAATGVAFASDGGHLWVMKGTGITSLRV
jgi:hypothetical protein